MRALLATLALALSTALTAAAEPVLKIINFTADWCPNCRILDPRIDEALLSFEDGVIEVVRLDMTNAGRGASPEQKLATQADAIRLADANGWRSGRTGRRCHDHGLPPGARRHRAHRDHRAGRSARHQPGDGGAVWI